MKEENNNSFASIFAPISTFLTAGFASVASIITSNNAVEVEQTKLDVLDKQLALAKETGKNAVEIERLKLEITKQTSTVALARTANNSKTAFYVIIFGFFAFIGWLLLKPKKAEAPIPIIPQRTTL